MHIKRNLIIIALVGAASAAIAQSLSPQQLASLRRQFLREVSESVDGSSIKIGTLPLDRLNEVPVPASKIQEADPIAGAGVAANAAAIASLDSSQSGSISSLQASISSLQSSVSSIQSEPVLAPTGITTNIVLASATQTNTFNFVSGVLTGHTQVGP
jgi:hypothetical protein